MAGCVNVTQLGHLVLERFPHEDSRLNAQALCMKVRHGCATEANWLLFMLSDTFPSSLGPLQERLDLQVSC